MTDVRGLESDYDIRGELRGTDAARFYIGRRKQDGGEEVAITVFQGPKDGGNNALSHFASDAQLLSRNEHPNVPRVIEGRWVGNDQFALVTERVVGVTLDEMLERGEKFTNPRAAMLLQQVAGALDWAREQGVVQRVVLPETLVFDRATNRVQVTFTPSPVPMTGVPGSCGDARTIGRLAWAILTGHPHGAGETRSLGEVCPNLAKRVVDATDEMIRCKDTEDGPDIETYLGIVGAGDALKAAEVELAAQKEEYDEAHAREIQKCEMQREQVEQHAAEQAAMLAGEKEEFTRAMADERAAMDAEREQMRAALADRQRHLSEVRKELDEQRAELERRLAELEQYRMEVEKVRDEAIKVREEANRARDEAHRARDAAHEAHRNAARDEARDEAKAIPVVAEMPRAPEKETSKPLPVVAAATIPDLPAPPPKVAKPPKAPKWGKMDRVEIADEEIVPANPGRPRWMIPAGVATLVLILVAVVYGVTHRNSATNVAAPIPAAPQTASMPRGGFLTQSAGGNVAPTFNGTPLAKPGDSTTTVVAPPTPVDSAAQRAMQDSAAVAAAARAKRAAAREEAARQAAAEERAREQARAERARIDSARSNEMGPPAPTPVTRPPGRDSVHVDTVFKRDTSFRRDSTTTRPRPDTMTTRP